MTRAIWIGLMTRQVELAVDEAHVVILLVDTAGRTAADEQIAEQIRRSGKPVVLVVNKTEGRAADEAVSEFYALGMGDPIAISATRGDRVQEMLSHVLDSLPPEAESSDAPIHPQPGGMRFAVLGRPNVGKSTLINRFLGESASLLWMSRVRLATVSLSLSSSTTANTFWSTRPAFAVARASMRWSKNSAS